MDTHFLSPQAYLDHHKIGNHFLIFASVDDVEIADGCEASVLHPQQKVVTDSRLRKKECSITEICPQGLRSGGSGDLELFRELVRPGDLLVFGATAMIDDCLCTDHVE